MKKKKKCRNDYFGCGDVIQYKFQFYDIFLKGSIVASDAAIRDVL